MALSELSFATDNFRSKLVDFTDITRGGLNAVRDITGHEYQSLEYGRIDGPDGYAPFFRGIRQSHEVDMFSMSASEFWVHFVLAHLRIADKDAVVLIDEPESFLAQPGHRAFIDEIARLTLAAGCQTIIATHSDTMVRRIPSSLLLQVTQSSNGAIVSEVAGTGALLRALGRERVPVCALVFVEDALASTVVRAMMNLLAPDDVDKFDVIDSGGKDIAVRGAGLFKNSQRLRAMAVLDGDQRGKYTTECVLFLPGAGVPEIDLLDSLRSAESIAAERLHVSVSDLRIGLEVAGRASHQLVFEVMGEVLAGSSAEKVRDLAIELWLQQSEVAVHARTLIGELLAGAAPAR
ncbi:hypothetical protein QMK17_02895 [Rhodococcus sp. G-MC3]|uniref:hypothetical protein n=1 Tax=Rhodococcus sp. G-MC3 TaxID=3046209 RepID=UPI0024BB0CA3|nr:hypothetical protein [Rhodococcus sp. G-MC3]MDJ0392279.1 hypothetical protein [Rhodococcus sp. G-MC3]